MKATKIIIKVPLVVSKIIVHLYAKTLFLSRIPMAAIAGILLTLCSSTLAQNIFSETFDGYYNGNQNATQLDTGLLVSYGGLLPLWTASGDGAIHAVNQNGLTNYAVMIFDGNPNPNIVTMSNGIAANDAGEVYQVAFVAGPAAYAHTNEAATTNQILEINVLRGDNSVLYQWQQRLGTWPHALVLNPYSFNYVGDGSGPIRLQMTTATPGDVHFSGAIDNLTVTNLGPGVIFSQFSGVNNALTASDPLFSSNALGWERFPGVEWNVLEPTQGNWQQSTLDAYAAQVDTYTAVGVKVLPMLGYGTSFSGGNGGGYYVSAQAVPLWTNYVTKVVSELRAHGVVYFQVWNEAYPNSSFWSGNNISDYFTNVLKPASQVIRSLGGKVVYGGYPSGATTSTGEYISWLDTNSAWGNIDVLDIHYYDASDMSNVYSAAVSRGYSGLGMWQSECGFDQSRYMLPWLYPKALHWGLGQSGLVTNGFKLMWYADWAPNDKSAYGYECNLYSGNNQWHAATLQPLAHLFTTNTIVRYGNVLNNKSLTATYDLTKSIVSFQSGKKIISVIYLNSSDVGSRPSRYSLQLTYPAITSSGQVASVQRIDMSGYSTTPTVSYNSGELVVTTTPVDSSSSPIKSWNDLDGSAYIFYVVITVN